LGDTLDLDITRGNFNNGDKYWTCQVPYIKDNRDSIVDEMFLFLKKHNYVVSKLLRGISSDGVKQNSSLRSAIDNPLNTTWTYSMYNIFHLLQPSLNMWYIFKSLSLFLNIVMSETETINHKTNAERHQRLLDGHHYQNYRPELNVHGLEWQYRKNQPVWVQSWLNSHTSDNIETELGWHNHAFPYHGYIQIDPKNTATTFDDGTTIYNDVGQIYFGRGDNHHCVRKLEDFTGSRITLGFDLTVDYGSPHNKLETDIDRMSFLPLV
jgi:hypothetical protein